MRYLLVLALLAGCLGPRIGVQYDSCLRYEDQNPTCDYDYYWQPGYWSTYGYWKPGRYHRREFGPRIRDHRGR